MDFRSVPQAKKYAKMWGWQGWMLDTIAKGDQQAFNRYLVYPFVQVLMMGVKLKQKELVSIAEHDQRKAEQKRKEKAVKRKVRKSGKR